MDSLDRSVATANAGIALLADEAPSEASYRRVLAAAAPLRQALQLYGQTVNMWRTAVAHAAAMDYGSAAQLVTSVEKLAEAFLEACGQARAWGGCTRSGGGGRGGRGVERGAAACAAARRGAEGWRGLMRSGRGAGPAAGPILAVRG
jgi:hypothetical protein